MTESAPPRAHGASAWAFGRNTAQIEALYQELASLDANAWFGLTAAEVWRGADPRIAAPEYRAFARRQMELSRLGADVINRARTHAMATGRWPDIEQSVVRTSGASIELAFELAFRLSPDATAENLADKASAYTGPITSLTLALILRPFITPTEFEVLWAPYEPFFSASRLPPPITWRAPSTIARNNTTGDDIGGCLVYVIALPIFFGFLVLMPLIWFGDAVSIRDSSGAIAQPFLWAAGAFVALADVLTFWWFKIRTRS